LLDCEIPPGDCDVERSSFRIYHAKIAGREGLGEEEEGFWRGVQVTGWVGLMWWGSG